MTKQKAEHVDISPPVVERPMCVICGSYEGELSESAGAARWHKDCGDSHPDVVAKVKARA